ncbi:hypothetical protein AB6A40_000436 [Gnathostoma spinigerum]|uniref:Gamma-soluble NSF attachment protein n=1 Tax=Gnathostoma spinigerum TaxID=75299 RepID=A0ABD6EAM2_9BILA
MDAANERRIQEAKTCIQKAEEHLKTSVLKMKFKPDYDSAAIEYGRAAVCYKNANDLNMACDMYIKASSAFSSSGNLFHCAKCKESAAMISRDMGDSENAMKYMEEAADCYAESGSSESSAMALDKAGKFLETVDPEKAISIYEKALMLVRQTDRSKMISDFSNRIARLNMKLGRYSEAIKAVEEEFDNCTETKTDSGRVGQLTCSLVLLHLAKEDSIAASKSLENCMRFLDVNSPEVALCNSLITVYESGDDDAFQELLRRPIMRNMDNEYLRLMKKLKAGGAESRVEHLQSGENREDYEEDLK